MLSRSNECPWLIAVHGGAGYHSTGPAAEKAVKHALRSACTSAVEILKRGSGVNTDAVERAVCNLEDEDELNAGYGSNLTIDGNVECDASIIDGATHDFGSVGAVQGVKNPIALARAIMQNSTKPHHLGRVPPLTLVGTGAHSFAESSGLQLVNPDALKSEHAHVEWKKWKSRLESSSAPEAQTASAPDCRTAFTHAASQEMGHSLLEDTVGAVVCGSGGGMTAGVSSGGLLLKHPGRIGEAAVFGAGVWAHSPPDARTGVACSVSGTGEAIIRSVFARTLVESLCAATPEDTHDILCSRLEAFCEENGAREEANVGALVVTKEPIDEDMQSSSDSNIEIDLPPISGNTASNAAPQFHSEKPAHEKHESQPVGIKLRLWCAFTTQSMAIAYASSEDEKPRALILRHLLRRNPGDKWSAHIAALPLSG